MASTKGPRFSSDGYPYYIVSGRTVWASQLTAHSGSVSSARGTGQSVDSSTCATVRSVDSRFESTQFPPPTTGGSYPPITPQSSLKARMTSGYPTARFSVGEGQGSAPASGHQTRDPYRSAMDPSKTRTGPPLNSPFSQQHTKYKDLDAEAESAEQQYKEYLKSARNIPRKVRDQNPGLYDGEPCETKEWHRTAARYAGRARELCRE